MCWILRRRFEKFHQKNPDIYEEFKAVTKPLMRRDFYSATMLWGVMRYHRDIRYTDPIYKLNDHLTPYYARLWLDDHPGKNGSNGERPFFELRKLKNGGEDRVDPDSFPDDEKLWRPPGTQQLPFPDPDDDPDDDPESTEWLA